MRYRFALVLLFLLLTACATSDAGDSALFRFTDPRGDDYGDGSIAYPMSGDMQKGDLDLIELAAYPASGGTLFVATFAQPIDVPARQTVDAIGTSLSDLARYGFYTFNLDIYIDTDRQPGSGSVSMLPGRKAGIDPATAWEKAIVVTPDPGLARSELRRLLFNDERREMKAGGEKMDESTMTAKRDQLRANVEAYTFFPERIRIIGSRVEFFVPADFLGGGARPEWAYVVAVSGADLVHRMDQRGRLLGSEVYDTLFILPVQVGRPLNAWGTNREDAENQPLIIDLIVPPGAEQKQILGDFAGARSAVIPGVVPGP